MTSDTSNSTASNYSYDDVYGVDYGYSYSYDDVYGGWKDKPSMLSGNIFYSGPALKGAGGSIYFDDPGTISIVCADKKYGLDGFVDGLSSQPYRDSMEEIMYDIEGHSATSGGFMYLSQGNASVDSCYIHDNSATDGGVFYVANGAMLTVTDSFMHDNNATQVNHT